MMRLTNRMYRILTLVLGMLISATVTSTIYLPNTMLGDQGDSRNKTQGKGQEIMPDNCCMNVSRSHELPVPDRSLQADTTDEPMAVGDVWEWVRTAFSLPPVDTDRVRRHIDEYTKHPYLLEQLLGRAEPYLYHVVKRLEQHGMPAELALLPFVESAYDPFATSPAGAAGVWQFMPATAVDVGLDLDWWYDGRRDIIASTDAAIGYLQQLSKDFDGNWFLALAAYNAGSARVRRAISHNRETGEPVDYWYLALPKETRSYVPKLIALRAIISNPDDFNVKLPAVPAMRYFGTVEVEGQIELSVAARLAGVSLDEFLRLNPGYDRSLTPPDKMSTLLVPIDVEHVMAERIAGLPEDERIRSIRHQIRTGDNLSTIAMRYGTTVSALRKVNRLSGSKIIAGEMLMIPVGDRNQKIANAGYASLM